MYVRAPQDFPELNFTYIERGANLETIADQLAEEHIVRSANVLKLFIYVFGDETAVFAGDYFFEEKQSVFSIAWRITHGDYGFDPARVTFTEGMDVFDIAEVLRKKLGESFSADDFMTMARAHEGYLFPDTYLFLPKTPPQAILDELLKNFEKKTHDLQQQAKKENKTFADIITMASIIEKEAITFEDKKIISGILWKRLSIHMPLQVDATFSYVNGKNTFELTYDDLAIDSPYNTYKYKGLPPGPISNPGIDSIMAALEPEKSSYLFYLSDLTSIIHYAATFEEHKKNKSKYLN